MKMTKAAINNVVLPIGTRFSVQFKLTSLWEEKLINVTSPITSVDP